MPKSTKKHTLNTRILNKKNIRKYARTHGMNYTQKYMFFLNRIPLYSPLPNKYEAILCKRNI